MPWSIIGIIFSYFVHYWTIHSKSSCSEKCAIPHGVEKFQIQALSIALSHPIYSYTKFNSDPTNRHFIPLNISLQDLVDRFSKGTSGGHLRYIGYKADTNKLAFCLFYNGTQYDALFAVWKESLNSSCHTSTSLTWVYDRRQHEPSFHSKNIWN